VVICATHKILDIFCALHYIWAGVREPGFPTI